MSMSRYVAFLRAVNVGGNTIIKMADLKRMFEAAGLEDVQTYIQSGNVIFDSDEAGAASLEKQIESALKKATGKEIRLFVRTMREILTIAAKCPFAAAGPETVHVVFLGKKPGDKQQQSLLALRSNADDFSVKGREVYNLRRDREKSVFSNNLMEKILEMPATTRNLTTIKKIAEKYE
jgi:uncharacterized protein (DUF1697 family)